MKTIEEKLQMYFDLPMDEEHWEGFKIGFKNGVAFAQRWIPVEEELPTFPDQKNMVKVIAKLDVGIGFDYLICSFTKSGKFFNTTQRLLPIELCTGINTAREDVTEFVVSWRPIEIK